MSSEWLMPFSVQAAEFEGFVQAVAVALVASSVAVAA
jgi:hypothetical protein